MITMLQGWQGDIVINDKPIADISRLDSLSGRVHIKLYPKGYKANGGQSSHSNSVKQVEVEERKEYKIRVRQYMTRKSTPEFDFMAKWNNDTPMPLRTMVGWIEKETPGMYYMHLQGKAYDTEVNCMRCGRRLTNPISRAYGIGPECLCKVGFVGAIEDVNNISGKLQNVKWEGWVIKKAIESQEEV